MKKKQATENSSSKTKKAETAASAPSKLQVEKAVLVAVDSRRSRRLRKPFVPTVYRKCSIAVLEYILRLKASRPNGWLFGS